MATLDDLYVTYCRRRGCKPNSSFSQYLQKEFERHGGQRVLESVDLSGNYVGAKGIIPVLDLVKNVKTVRRLNVSSNMLEHEQLAHLVYCLALHPSIEDVDFSKNCLHDASLNHILRLLEANENIVSFNADGNEFTAFSLAQIADQLAVNKVRVAQRQRDPPCADTGRYFRAQVRGSLDSETSGGFTHFSTWWKNPQYIMRTSRRARVRIVMDVHDATAAIQAGFVIFRSDGTRKVISMDTDCVVAESNVDHSHCHVTMWTEGHESAYAVMPYTFSPGRAISFTVTAELCHDDPAEPEGWVTLDLVDPELDWLVYLTDGEWTAASAGGSPAQHLWSHNPMIQLQYAGSTHAYRMVSPATVVVKLSKSIDPDVNDERRIGFDVVTLDAGGDNRPPIYCTDAVRKCTCPHEHSTSVTASFVVPCAALDVFVVPSTERPGELGSYTVAIFSTVPLSLATSAFPHGWNHRVVRGVWDEANCGGSREHSMSWKCNPSVALSFDTNRSPPDLTLFLEGMHSTVRGSNQEDGGASSAQTEDVPVTGDELRELQELREFSHRHKADTIDGCLSIVEASPPLYRVLYSAEFSGGSAARLAVPSISEAFYLLAATRYAGQLGEFVLHIFSSLPFVVGDVTTLALRERQSQLAQYALESENRRSCRAGAVTSHQGMARREELDVAHNEILRKCMVTGEKFVDRDFPRGGSSLWLDPASKIPADFGQEIFWKRPTEMVEDVVFLPQWVCDCPFPYSRREWFASVVRAVSTKPGWLRAVAIGYDVPEGLVRFRFFKDGKWVVVTIDDYLPCDNTMELCMGRPAKNKNDFFFPLIEKAYAKLHRCYEALERKVTPEVGIVDLMCHGLMDLSGYLPIHFPLSSWSVLPHEEQESIWMKLKSAIDPGILFGLLLRSDSPGAVERVSLGILADHLYPVLDARFVEGQRLVKVAHWGQVAEINWCGKWRAKSTKWTSTLCNVLEFDEDDNETFWLSLDEVLFYFTDLIMTAATPNSDWVSADFHGLPDCCDDPLLAGSQFTLELGDFPPDVNNLRITLGLHQPDARARVIRKKDALAKYRTAVGLSVVAVEDNTVWLKELQDCDVVARVEPCLCRDVTCSLTIDKSNVVGNKRLTLIAFREGKSAPNVPFMLSAWSESCTVTLSPVRRDCKVKVSGVWPKDFPVGAPSSFFWRDCPQFFVFPSESTDVSFSLYQDVGTGEAPKPIGFTVHRAMECRSYLEYDADSVVLSVRCEASPSVAGAVRLLGMKERRGMPYIIVPFCTAAAPGGKFYIEAAANRPLRLCDMDPRLGWHRERLRASFALADGSVGGSPRFSSWRSSPQFCLTFPVGAKGRLFIALKNDDANDTLTEVGMMLLRGDNQWDCGQRRKLFISPEDLVARSEEKIDGVTLDCEVDVLPGCTLILVVYATMPYLEAAVSVAVYSAFAVEVSPVREWQHVAMVQGSWELGYTAGGGSEEVSSWVNNPFVALNTFRKTQVVALLLQYPRGPDKPIVKRAGKKKVFLPPIIVNPHNRMEIALDLNAQDAGLTQIATTSYTRNSEVVMVATVPPADSLPFLFVPHTRLPECNGDFKLFVYADSLIELHMLSKDRIPYV